MKKILCRVLAGFLSVFMMFGIFSATDIMVIAEEIQKELSQIKMPKTEDELIELLDMKHPDDIGDQDRQASTDDRSVGTRNVSDGDIFYLRNKTSGKYLDVAGFKDTNNADVSQWDFTGTKNQQWKLIDAGDGYYNLAPMHSNNNMVLDIRGNSTANYAQIQIYQKGDYSSEKFKFKLLSDGSYQILSALTNDRMCLTNWGGGHENGAFIVMDTVSSEHNGMHPDQGWYLEPASSGGKSAVPTVGKTYNIRSRMSGQYLEVLDNATSGGRVGQNFFSGEPNQQFTLEQNGTGYVRLIPGNAKNKALELSFENKPEDGGFCPIWLNDPSDTDRQRYKMIDNGNGTYRMAPKIEETSPVTVRDTPYTTKSKVYHVNYSNAANQQWIFEEVVTNFTIMGAKAAVFQDQNVVPVENESQLSAQFDQTSLVFNSGTHRAGGFLTFHDGSETIQLVLMVDLGQSHMDITGKKSIIGSRVFGISDGYQLSCFRIEKECSPTTLLVPNRKLAGQNLVSIGILQESTNKMFYVQTTIDPSVFDYLYNNSWPNTGTAGYDKNSTLTKDSLQDDEALPVIKEQGYLSLMSYAGSVEDVNSAKAGDSASKSYGADEAAPLSESTTDQYPEMGEFLDYISEHGEVDLNSRELVNRVPDEFFKGMQPNTRYSEFGGWTFNVPYYFHAKCMPLAGVPNSKIIYFAYVDLTAQSDPNISGRYLMDAEMRHNIYVTYDSVTNKLFSNINKPYKSNNVVISNMKLSFLNQDNPNGFFYQTYYEQSKPGSADAKTKLLYLLLGKLPYASLFGDVFKILYPGTGDENIQERQTKTFPRNEEGELIKYGGRIRQMTTEFNGMRKKGDFKLFRIDTENMPTVLAIFEFTVHVNEFEVLPYSG